MKQKKLKYFTKSLIIFSICISHNLVLAVCDMETDPFCVDVDTPLDQHFIFLILGGLIIAYSAIKKINIWEMLKGLSKP